MVLLSGWGKTTYPMDESLATMLPGGPGMPQGWVWHLRKVYLPSFPCRLRVGWHLEKLLSVWGWLGRSPAKGFLQQANWKGHLIWIISPLQFPSGWGAACKDIGTLIFDIVWFLGAKQGGRELPKSEDRARYDSPQLHPPLQRSWRVGTKATSGCWAFPFQFLLLISICFKKLVRTDWTRKGGA